MLLQRYRTSNSLILLRGQGPKPEAKAVFSIRLNAVWILLTYEDQWALEASLPRITILLQQYHEKGLSPNLDTFLNKPSGQAGQYPP